MAVWTRFGDLFSWTAGEAFSTLVERVRTVFAGDAQTRRQVAFSIAMIALSAKMAKADGIVTPDEVKAFREIFEIPEKEGANVARLYNLAKQDVAGFDSYAQQVKKLFPGDDEILEDVMDGLFHIAKADGLIHERETGFLDQIADIFGLSPVACRRIKMRHVGGDSDPFEQLGAERSWDDATLKQHYRRLVRENHPDRMIARGVPEEFVAIANDRLASINQAWESVSAERGL